MKQNKLKYEKEYRIAYIIPTIVCCLVVTTNIMITVAAFFDAVCIKFNMDNIIKIDLLSIFGIAVSVWIGLSITNMIDRSTLKKAQFDIKEIKETLNLTKEKAKWNIVNCLYSDTEYTISRWFADKIKPLDYNCFDVKIYDLLSKEESWNQMLRQRLNKKLDKREIIENLYKDYVQLVKQIESLITEKGDHNNIIQNLLNVRLLEMNFRFGYWLPNDDGIVFFINALDFFTDKEHDIKIGWSSITNICNLDETTFIKRLKSIDANEAELLAYILHFIGESFRKLVDYYNKPFDNMIDPKQLEVYKKNALRICSFCTIVAEQYDCKCENYYRNYGCALEKCQRDHLTKKVLNEAIIQYKLAFDLDKENINIYHCLVSSYHKLFDLLRKEARIVSKDFMKEYEYYATLFLKFFPENYDSYFLGAVFYRDKYLTASESTKNAIAHKFHECIDIAALLNENMHDKEIWKNKDKIKCQRTKQIAILHKHHNDITVSIIGKSGT